MRRLAIGLGIAAVLLIGAAGTYKISKATCFALTGEVICRVATDEKLVALTFDDGPTDEGLDAVLPVLSRYNAKATFFVIGFDSVEDPKLVRRIVASGHEVGNHSFHHRRMVFETDEAYDDEIRSTDKVLRLAGVRNPSLFRPPYGKKLVGLPRAVERNNYKMIMWDSGDPPDRDPKVYAAKVLKQVRPGSITLIHPMYSANQTERDALPLILEGLKARGYRVVTVSELISAGRKSQESR